MSTTLTVPHRLATDPARAWVGAVTARLGAVLAAFAHRRRIRRAVDQLERLDDRLLADMGLTRQNVTEVVMTGRRPPRRPT